MSPRDELNASIDELQERIKAELAEIGKPRPRSPAVSRVVQAQKARKQLALGQESAQVL